MVRMNQIPSNSQPLDRLYAPLLIVLYFGLWVLMMGYLLRLNWIEVWLGRFGKIVVLLEERLGAVRERARLRQSKLSCYSGCRRE